MAEPSAAAYPAALATFTTMGGTPVNQKTFVVSGAHSDSIQTITTTAVISGIAAPCYLVNGRTGEILYAEGISGAQFTSVARGADGSSAAAMVDGDVLYHILVANFIKQAIREIIATQTELGVDPAGSLTDVKARLAVSLNNDGTLKSNDGWTADSATWTYASATTFTVAGDVTAQFRKGTKLKLTQTTAKYFYVVASSYGAPNTTVTVTGGSDYTLAASTITSPFYSYQATPQGFPAAFNYTPTGVSASNVTLTGRFVLHETRCMVDLKVAFTGGITYTTGPTLPIAASASIIDETGQQMNVHGTASYMDAATALVLGTLFPTIQASATTLIITISTGVAISATSPITWANGDRILAHVSYEI